MPALQSHYDNLQLPRDASTTAIDAARHALWRQYGTLGARVPDGDAIRASIDQSHRVLSDAVQRREHDTWLDARPPAIPAPIAVFEAVARFFMPGGVARPGAAAHLLRAACVGNPERTLQGELFAYLKTLYPNTVLEYRLHCLAQAATGGWRNGRSVDIMVMDERFAAVCAIELKHYSRVQDGFDRLLSGLEADRQRFERVPVPLVQVGLYTDLSEIPELDVAAFEAYRFITAYGFAPDGRRRWRPALTGWAETYFERHVESLRGPPASFPCAGATVSGRVHYLVGLGAPSAGD